MQVLQNWAGKSFRRDLKERDTKQTEEEKRSCSSRSSALLHLKSREDLCRLRMLQQYSGDGFFFQRCSLAHLIASSISARTHQVQSFLQPALYSRITPEGSSGLGTLGIRRSALAWHAHRAALPYVRTCTALFITLEAPRESFCSARPCLPCSFDNALLSTADTHVGTKPVIFTLSQKARCSCHNLSLVRTEQFTAGKRLFCYRIWHV